MAKPDLSSCIGFDWDEGNTFKNWENHKVSPFECEQVFFNKPLIVLPDEAHSSLETRYYCLGRTDRERRLFVVFTVRKKKVRVISARDMTRKEIEVYNEQKKEDS